MCHFTLPIQRHKKRKPILIRKKIAPEIRPRFSNDVQVLVKILKRLCDPIAMARNQNPLRTRSIVAHPMSARIRPDHPTTSALCREPWAIVMLPASCWSALRMTILEAACRFKTSGRSIKWPPASQASPSKTAHSVPPPSSGVRAPRPAASGRSPSPASPSAPQSSPRPPPRQSW